MACDVTRWADWDARPKLPNRARCARIAPEGLGKRLGMPIGLKQGVGFQETTTTYQSLIYVQKKKNKGNYKAK